MGRHKKNSDVVYDPDIDKQEIDDVKQEIIEEKQDQKQEDVTPLARPVHRAMMFTASQYFNG